jgi:DNA-binding transcriptional LysR family regulator
MHTGTKYLPTFIAAIETGSFMRAAQTLHITPSTVSYQIKQLETWMGAALFERTGRKVLPTALGERLFAICGQFMGELGALQAAAQGDEGSQRPVLRIATGSSFGRYVLTPLLQIPEFSRAMVDLRFGTDDDVCNAVTNGRADAGFSYTVRPSNTLTFALVYQYPLVLIAAHDQRVPRNPAEWIAGSPFITYDDCEPTFARWFETNLNGMPKQLRTMGHCTEIEEAIALVAAGRGVSIVPGHTLKTALKARQVREIKLQGKQSTTDTVFHVARTGSFQDSIVNRLLALLPEYQPVASQRQGSREHATQQGIGRTRRQIAPQRDPRQ